MITHVYIKACLARGYIPRAWGQVKMTFVPVPDKTNCTEAKSTVHAENDAKFGDQKYQGRNSSICPLHRKQFAYKPCGYTYTGNSGKQVVTLSFPR